MANTVNTALLIKEIEKKPLLWDVNSNEFTSKHRRKSAWFEICTTLIPNFKKETDTVKKVMIQDLMSKWKIIRDTYVRYRKLKLKQVQTGVPAKKIREHTYVRELAFLNKIIESNSSENNELNTISTRTSVSNSEESKNDVQIIDLNELSSEENSNKSNNWLNETTTTEKQVTPMPYPVVFVERATVPINPPIEQNEIITSFPVDTARTDEHQTSFDMNETMEYSDTPNTTTQINGAPIDTTVKCLPYQKDEDLAFFYSLLPLVRTLNIDQKLSFRLQTLQLAQSMRNPPKVQVHRSNNSPPQNYSMIPAIHLHLSNDQVVHTNNYSQSDKSLNTR